MALGLFRTVGGFHSAVQVAASEYFDITSVQHSAKPLMPSLPFNDDRAAEKTYLQPR